MKVTYDKQDGMYQLLEQLGFKDDNGVYLPMLSEFVYKLAHIAHGKCFSKDVYNYTDLITQPLTKGMFVPCDEDGNVLEKPENYEDWCNRIITINHTQCQQYQQALERVLFDGWKEIHRHKGEWFVYNDMNGMLNISDRTIEQAINNGVKFYLRWT